jgi:CrcB protein
VVRAALVGLAGALGAMTRYGIGLAVGVRPFPWATLGVNVVGSFLLGAVLAGPGAGRWSTTTTTFVAVGFLGAFTTFSTFSHETTTMLRAGRTASAAAYVAASLATTLVASACGYAVGRLGAA